MNFKRWFQLDELISTLGDTPTTPQDQRSDLKKGGEGGCLNLPMGMRASCEPTTSAFPTYKAKMKKKSKS